jgi:hypothetical protein
MNSTIVLTWGVGLVICYWLGYRCGRARPDRITLQQQLDLCRIQRLADGLYRVGDQYTHYPAVPDGVISKVRLLPRTVIDSKVTRLVRVTN